MRSIAVAAALCAAVFLVPAAAGAESAVSNPCGGANPMLIADDLTGVASPCAVPRGVLFIESEYFQNASRVGGTALAAYPMFRLRTGILDRVEVVVDTPSQIAESGRDGAGLYPSTHLGFGVDYTFVQTGRAAVSLGTEVLPPISQFATTQTQSKYALDLTSGYRLTQAVTLNASLAGESSRTAGFQHIDPITMLGVAYQLNLRTQLSTSVGTRTFGRVSTPQQFGNVALNELLRRNVSFNVGLGTTFNPISNAKAHYLASGVNVRI
jgi:hypothetical protein